CGPAPPPDAYSLSLHDALPIFASLLVPFLVPRIEALFVAALLTGLAFAFYLVTLQNLIGVLSRPEQRTRNFSTFSVIGAMTNFVDRKSTRLNSSHVKISYAVFC